MTIGWGMSEYLVKRQCKCWYEFRSGDYTIVMLHLERSFPNNDPAWMIVKFLNNKVIAFSAPILIEEFENFESEVSRLGDGALYLVEQKRLDFLTPYDLDAWQRYLLRRRPRCSVWKRLIRAFRIKRPC